MAGQTQILVALLYPGFPVEGKIEFFGSVGCQF